jgi:hypothetical protein
MFRQEDLLDTISERTANALGHVGQDVVAGLLLVCRKKFIR